MAYTPEQNKAFNDYLAKQGKTAKTATKEDAQAFLNPAPVVTPTPIQTPTEPKPLIKTDLQTGKETIVGSLPPTQEPPKVETPKPVVPEVKTETKVETPKVNTPTTTTDITYNEDKKAYDPKKVISKAEQFTGSDGKTYQTVRNSDNTLTTIDVTTGQPVTGKYTDTERDSIKQGFLGGGVQEQPKPTSNDYFSMINQGLDIPINEKNTIDYKLASNRKANLDKFSSMSSNDLANSIKNGQFLPGTQEYNDLKLQNPQLVTDAEKLHSINSINEPKKDVVDIQTIMSEYLTKLMSDDEKVSYKDKLSQNPEIVKLNESLGAKAKELADIKDSLEFADEDFDKQMDGKAVTKGYKRYKLGEINRELTRQYNSVLADYNSTAGQIKTISEDIKYEMESERQNEQDKLNQLSTAYNMYQGLTADDRALALQQKQLEQEYTYTYGDLNSENPTLQNIAIERAVADLYTKYPLPGMESQAMKVQKVKDRMAQGMTGSEAIASVESEIRGTERYKNYINPPAEQMTPYQQAQIDLERQKLAGTGTSLTGLTISQNYGDTSPNAKDNVKLANGKVGTPGVDYAMNENTVINSGIEGEVISTGNKGDYGNQVVIKDSEGNLHMYSHLNQVDVKVGDKITAGTQIALSGNTGFSTGPHLDYRVKSTKGEWLDPNSYNGVLVGGTGGYTQDKIELLAEIAQIQSETEKRKALEGSGFTLQDLTKYKSDASAGRIQPTENQIQASLKTISDIQGIAETDWTDATGKFDYSRLLGLQGASNAGVLIENLRDVASFNNLGMLKGPMSDKDIAFLKSVSSKLDPTQSNKQFEKNIVEMYNIAARKAGIPEITKLSDIPKDRILPGQGTGAGNIMTPKSDPLGLFNN